MKAEQLRKSILQLAIQGKLVPQDPNDEPASVLLERIREEKQRLIKEGKIKKDKIDSFIYKGEDNRYYEKVGSEVKDITDEIEIELPDTWCVCRFSTIANIFTGNSINEQEKAQKYTCLIEGYNYIATKDVSFEHEINYHNGVKIPFETQFRIAHKGTPLLCIEGGSAGRKIGFLTEDVCFGNKLCAFEPFGVNTKYLYYYLQSPKFIQVFKSNTTGIIGGVSINVLKTLLFFLPPLLEQARIVAEIEKFEPLIAEYDKLEQQATKLDDEIYDKLKKSILQYAIQGKLVPQDPNDEPASALLERIRAEKKAKLGKKYVDSYIYKGDDNCYYEHIVRRAQDEPIEVPFDIPDNWSWVRWGNLSFSIQYGYNAPAKESGRIKMVRISDIHNNEVDWEHVPFCDINETDIKTYLLKENDILFARTGGTVGKSYLVTCVPEEAIYAGYLIRTQYSAQLSAQYLKYFMESSLYWMQLKDGTIATAQPNCNGQTLSKMILPLPPLAEQKRIVAKINEIFAML